MTKGCKNFTEIMRLSKYDKNRIQSQKSVNLEDFIQRFCHKLKINERQMNQINSISTKCKELRLVNDNTPPAMASGCIFIYIKSMNLKITKKEISEVCKISEVTINKCSKKLENINEIKTLIESFKGDKI